MPLALASLLLIVPTGLLMFAVHSGELLTSSLFALKMLLVLSGGILAVVFHTGPYTSVAAWASEVNPPVSAKLCAVGSILGWLAVIVCASQLRT